MSDHPILFSRPMVRALLDGRKTQTRRRLKSARVFATLERQAWTLRGDDLARALQNAAGWRWLGLNDWSWEADAFPWQAPATRTNWLAHIGYAPGDRLWVREAWDFLPTREGHAEIAYWAGGGPIEHAVPAGFNPLVYGQAKIRPGIHLPRWASRLTLTVKTARIQKLQDIAEVDAKAEGWPGADEPPYGCHHPRLWYRNLWNSLNRSGSWDENPWICAYTFGVDRCNIDRQFEEAAE